MTDIRACLAEGAARLADAGIENPWREARLLLAHATGLNIATIIGYPEKPVCRRNEFQVLLDRRAAREPVSHLVGNREFWSLDFEVTPDTLDPRPDSETVVEAAFAVVSDSAAKIRIVDLGTGTGCLLAALLTMLPAAWGVGIDRSPAAAAVAMRNIAALGLADRAVIIVSDWTQPLQGKFELVVANPPYIPSAEISALEPEVSRFDPRSALDGGADGLAAIRRIAAVLPELLAPDGAAVIEFGAGQKESVSQIVRAQGLHVRAERADLAGRSRCLVFGLTDS